MNATEPKSGLKTGVWFYDDKCWSYRGELHIVMQFEPASAEHLVAPMRISHCPSCAGRSYFPPQAVRRWLILPP